MTSTVTLKMSKNCNDIATDDKMFDIAILAKTTKKYMNYIYLNNSKSLYYHKLDKFVSYGEVPHSSAITWVLLIKHN